MSRITKLVLPEGLPPARLRPLPGITPAPEETTTFVVRDFDDLPVLLAGPMVRRADQRAVYLWLATSAPVVVRVRILAPQGSFSGPITAWTVLGTGIGEQRRLGARLFVTRVQVSGSFAVGIVAYDVELQAPPGFEFTHGEGLVQRRDIAYGDAALPTFLLGQPDPHRLNLYHASCHKLHGPGADAREAASHRLESVWSNPAERPTAMLHTGDQIYADDVSPALLPAITVGSGLLLGWAEWVPAPVERSVLFTLAGTRGSMVREHGFTVDEDAANSHLFGFGEFAAMYLLSWSPEMWDALGHFISGFDVAAGRRRAAAARKLLANVPSYMIWDDHEITDDWPMTLQQRERVRASPLTSWIVANGMASCWFFQLWGNAAGRQPSFEGALQEYLDTGRSMTPNRADSRHDKARARYVVAVLREKGYDFVTPTSPPIMFLDTRTRRELHNEIQRGDHGDAVVEPPGLLDAEGFGALRAWAPALAAGATPSPMPVVVVSATPVVGYGPSESSLHILGDTYGHDSEAWGLEPSALRTLLDLLHATQRRVVLLSGDVHYGFAAYATYTRAGRAMDIVQLTSSALCNEPTGGQNVALTTVRQATPGAPSSGAVSGLEVSFAAVDATTVFQTNNFGIVRLSWTDGGGLSVAQRLVGASEGRDVPFDLP